MQAEVWKDIPGYEGRYQISNLGRVKSLKYYGHSKEGILEPSIDKKGYAFIKLGPKNNRVGYTVHQLVAFAFLEHNSNGMKTVVRHKQDNKADNSLENLKLGTQRENTHDYFTSQKRDLPLGVIKKRNKYQARIWSNNKRISLGCYKTPEEASEVYQKALELETRK